MRHRPIQYKRSEDDEILTVMELKHPESMFSTGPYANSIKTNGVHSISM